MSKSSSSKVSFWKFVSHQISTTVEDAKALAAKIESGEFVPHNDHGARYYKFGGYCYDIGRKPFLVEFSHGHIQRFWALSVTELRKACYLKRGDKVIRDPFFKEEVCPA